MNCKVFPQNLSGSVAAVASKSDAHRLLICAALSDGVTTIEVPERSMDIDATAACLRALGAGMNYDDKAFTVTPIEKAAQSPLLDCHESGSTLRFLLPVAAAVAENASLTGSGRLPERPIGALREAMERHGVRFSAPRLPLSLSGRLQKGVYELPGDVSSQYITGLLLALPLVGGGEIVLTTPLQSAGYVDMTVSTMARFGVTVARTARGWLVPEGRYRSPGHIRAAGDWSNAAFFLCAGAIGGDVTMTGLRLDDPQGDRRVLDILRSFGAEISAENGLVRVRKAPLRGVTVSLADVPDLLPILAVTAAFAAGETRFIDGARLRIKESDRLSAVAALLRSLGGDAEELPDGLIVRGKPLQYGVVDGVNDHRIVMAAAIAGVCGQGAVIRGAEAVEKSYPTFFEDLTALGGSYGV